MIKIKSFRELFVWQKSMDLAERSYRLSRRFKREDQLALGHEIRKTGISIPLNVAEGFGHPRHHTGEYIHHLWLANGSNNELQTQSLERARA
jgi:four helix bundle protein